jgi:hypothetical protein
MNRFQKFAVIIVFIFSALGALFTGFIIHEYTHYFDYKSVTNKDLPDELCALSLPTSTSNLSIGVRAGHYTLTLNESVNPELIKTKEKYAERKAYFIMLLPFILLLLCFNSLINKYTIYLWTQKL